MTTPDTAVYGVGASSATSAELELVGTTGDDSAATTTEPEAVGPLLVVVYLRVSTQTQVDSGAGLEVQQEACLAHAEAHGLTVVAVLSDGGVSGTKGLEERVGLADAMRMVKTGEAAGILVHKLDRLARDLMVQEQILADVWRAGGEVWSCSDAEGQYLKRDDPADPSRKLVRQLLGAVAEYDRAMIRARLLAGQNRKKDAGGYHAGRPPFGWKAVNRELVPVPAEQRVLTKIYEFADRYGGQPPANVLRLMASAGIRQPNGKPYHREQLMRILARRPMWEALQAERLERS